MNEQVATYYYGKNRVSIFACYDSKQDFADGNVSFYDIYNETGTCLNEGDPYEDFPTHSEIGEILQMQSSFEA
jgi:hypothetical protein